MFRTDRQHADYWLSHALPVIVCLCDLQTRTSHWEVVRPDTVVSTGKGIKILVPEHQIVTHDFRKAFTNLVTPVVSHDRFTTFATDDVSHGLAKRYSFDVVLNGTLTKEEVAVVVREATNEGVKRRYHRNHLVEGRWGDSDAHVVWTFVYLSAEDHARRNPICRGLWIHPGLDPDFAPRPFQGENIGDGLVVEWNANYSAMAHFYAERRISKEDYLDSVLPMVDELDKLFNPFSNAFSEYQTGALAEEVFVSKVQSITERFAEIYDLMTGLAPAPFECRDVESVLKSLGCNISNIELYFSPQGLQTWESQQRKSLANIQWKLAVKGLNNVKYELSKITEVPWS